MKLGQLVSRSFSYSEEEESKESSAGTFLGPFRMRVALAALNALVALVVLLVLGVLVALEAEVICSLEVI